MPIEIDGKGNIREVVADQALIDAEVRRQVIAKNGEIQVSTALQRLERLRAESGAASVRRVEVAGDAEPWFIQRPTFAKLAFAMSLTGRDEEGLLDLENDESFGAFIAALFRGFLVTNATDKIPYFKTLKEARTFVDDEKVAPIVAQLFYEISDFVPEVWPEGQGATQKALPVLRAMMTKLAPAIASSSLPKS